MLRLKYLIFPAVLVLGCLGGVIEAEAAGQVGPQDSLVITLTQTPGAVLVGNGFVIGDGSLVVTNYHLAFEISARGEHRMAGSVVVLSPYLGDACEAEIVAADKMLDLAVLSVPWKGHPALTLADDKYVLLADRVRVMSLYDMIRAAGPERSEPLRKPMGAQTQDCTVEFVAVRKGTPTFLALTGTEKLAVGWSGSPVLLGDKPEVAAIISQLTVKGPSVDTSVLAARGTAAAQVRQLLLESGLKKSMKPPSGHLDRPEDATDALLLCIEGVRGILSSKHFQSTFDSAQGLIRLRPKCIFGYRRAAYAADGSDKHELAVSYYQKALALNAEGSTVRQVYAQRLAERGQTDEALQLLEPALKSGKNRASVVLAYYTILSKRGESARCQKLATESLKDNPQNAHLWAILGSSQAMQKDYDAAVGSLRKAVELHPEGKQSRVILANVLERAERLAEAEQVVRDGLSIEPDSSSLQQVLVRVLERAGKLDEAEKVYRDCLKKSPEDAVVHFSLATFLARHRPEAKQEALELAEKSLSLMPTTHPDRAVMLEFLEKMRAKLADEKKEN